MSFSFIKVNIFGQTKLFIFFHKCFYFLGLILDLVWLAPSKYIDLGYVFNEQPTFSVSI